MDQLGNIADVLIIQESAEFYHITSLQNGFELFADDIIFYFFCHSANVRMMRC
jgi:hypothetical protein